MTASDAPVPASAGDERAEVVGQTARAGRCGVSDLVEMVNNWLTAMDNYERHRQLRNGTRPMIDPDPRPHYPRPNIVNTKGQRRRKSA